MQQKANRRCVQLLTWIRHTVQARKAIALFEVAARAKQKDQRVGILDRDDQGHEKDRRYLVCCPNQIDLNASP
jgi:hypothetical protein